jgi:hypothetical protein
MTRRRIPTPSSTAPLQSKWRELQPRLIAAYDLLRMAASVRLGGPHQIHRAIVSIQRRRAIPLVTGKLEEACSF